jgi:hypothetical protein
MDDGRLDQIERKVADLDQRASSMERAMDTVMQRSRAAMGVMIPPETRKHLRAAWRENLLAARSMLDHWAEHLDDGSAATDAAGDASSAHDGGRENIPID